MKLGPKTQIENNDTLSLGITYSCTDDDDKYYDVNESSFLLDNCIGWYTLQLIKPEETIHFVIELIGFDKFIIPKFYYSYTKEIKPFDREHYLNKDRSIIYIEKDKRHFHVKQILLNKQSSYNLYMNWQTNVKQKSINR